MPDSDALRLTLAADIAPLKSAMADAVVSVDSASTQMAAALKAQGLSAEDAASALKNLGLSASAVVSSEAALVPVTREAAVATTSFRSAMGAARVEMGAIEGSTGMMASGLARVAAQSELLAPLITAAFPVVAVFAFADIIGSVAEKLYDSYQNVFHLRSEFTALAEIEERVAHASFGVSNEIVGMDVTIAELTGGPVAGAKARLEALKNEIIEVGQTFETNGKKFSDLNASVQATLKSHMTFPAGDIKNQIGDVAAEIKRLKNLQFQGDDALRATGLDPNTIKEEEQAAEDLYRYLGLVQLKYEKQVEEANARLAKAQQEDAKEKASAAQRTAREQAEAQRKLQEDEQKAKMPTTEGMIAGMPDPAIFQAANEKIANEGQQAAAALVAATASEYNKLDDIIGESLYRRVEAIAKADSKTVEENEKSTAKMMHAWEKLSADINRPFTEAMDHVLEGTETASLAFRKMGSQIVVSVINTLTQATLKAIEFEAIAALIPGFGGGATFGSVFTGALGFERGGVVPSFDHGGIVGEWASAAGGAVVPIMAHAGEMVLPRDLSDGIQNAIRGGGLKGGSGGGDTHYHNHFHIGSVHGASAGELVKQLKTMVRRGELNFR